MSVRNYKLLQDRYIIVSDNMTGTILLNQPIDNTHFNRTTIIQMINDLIDDFVFFDSHGLNIKIGYKNT